MQFEVLHANFDYSNLSLTKVKHADSASFDHYHITDNVTHADYNLEGTIVEIKEVNSKSDFKWGKKAAAAAVGGIIAGPFGALAAGAYFGNNKEMICDVSLSTGHKFRIRIDKDAYKFLEKCVQSNCAKIAKEITNENASGNVVINTVATPVLETTAPTELTSFDSQQSIEPQINSKNSWAKKIGARYRK